jgi:hypothetical protein
MRGGLSRVDIFSSLLEKDRRPIQKIFERCIESGYCTGVLEKIECAALAEERVDTLLLLCPCSGSVTGLKMVM